MHGHRDMEIVTWVLSGALQHKDSLGHGEVLRPGEMQHMTAGRGIRHSEFNPSTSEPVHLYQIWLLPREGGLEPSYSQKAFAAEGRAGRWQLVCSPDGEDGSIKIEQDARIYLANLPASGALAFDFAAGRHGWLQILRGSLETGGQALAAGDALALSDEPRFSLHSPHASEVMLFDLA
jgi:redox-sensitive bicupin YhaK (pirin superfamily)